MRMIDPPVATQTSRIAVRGEDGNLRILDLFPIELPQHSSCRTTLLRIAEVQPNVLAVLDE